MKKNCQKAAAAMMSSLMVLSVAPPASMREITVELKANVETSYKYDFGLQGTPVAEGYQEVNLYKRKLII